MTLRTLNYGNYGIFLIMGNAGFCPSAVVPLILLIASLVRFFAISTAHIVLSIYHKAARTRSNYSRRSWFRCGLGLQAAVSKRSMRYSSTSSAVGIYMYVTVITQYNTVHDNTKLYLEVEQNTR